LRDGKAIEACSLWAHPEGTVQDLSGRDAGEVVSEDDEMNTEFIHEHRALIAVVEACWRERDPSYSWHVFDWMAYKLRCKYPIVFRHNMIIDINQSYS
jgi:hypothetical protein